MTATRQQIVCEEIYALVKRFSGNLTSEFLESYGAFISDSLMRDREFLERVTIPFLKSRDVAALKWLSRLFPEAMPPPVEGQESDLRQAVVVASLKPKDEATPYILEIAATLK